MSANTTGDEYSRGRTEEKRQERQPKVNPRYRPIIIVVWGIGLALGFVLSLFGNAVATVFWVVVISHLCLAVLVRKDINSIRRQGVEWGLSRHLWFAATLFFPLVSPLYYVYSGRVVRRENERRRRKQGLDTAEDAPADSSAGGSSAAEPSAGEPTAGEPTAGEPSE